MVKKVLRFIKTEAVILCSFLSILLIPFLPACSKPAQPPPKTAGSGNS